LFLLGGLQVYYYLYGYKYQWESSLFC
jgi:hypothetical protein